MTLSVWRQPFIFACASPPHDVLLPHPMRAGPNHHFVSTSLYQDSEMHFRQRMEFLSGQSRSAPANTGQYRDLSQYRPIPELTIFCALGINAKEALRQRIQSNWDGWAKEQPLANEHALGRKLTQRSAEPWCARCFICNRQKSFSDDPCTGIAWG